MSGNLGIDGFPEMCFHDWFRRQWPRNQTSLVAHLALVSQGSESLLSLIRVPIYPLLSLLLLPLPPAPASGTQEMFVE